MNNFVADEFQDLDCTYLNTAYLGPSPRCAKRAGLKALEINSNPSFFPHEKWRGIPDDLRHSLAQLLPVPVESIAHSTSVSEIISHVANGIEFSDGDRVAVINGEYPSNVLPWMNLEPHKSFKLDILEPKVVDHPETICFPDKTRVFCLSHVVFNAGKCHDLLSISKRCRDQGVLFVVDVTQSLGAKALSEEETSACDVIVGATYKWLLGAYGHAFGYFSELALDRIKSTHAGWLNNVHGQDTKDLLNYTTKTLPGATRFDRGQSPNMIGMEVLKASLEFLSQIGLEKIQAHNQNLVQHFLESFPTEKFQVVTPPDNHSSIVSLLSQNGIDPAKVSEALNRKGIDLSVRQNFLRLSFHLFNTEEQVEQVCRVFKDL